MQRNAILNGLIDTQRNAFAYYGTCLKTSWFKIHSVVVQAIHCLVICLNVFFGLDLDLHFQIPISQWLCVCFFGQLAQKWWCHEPPAANLSLLRLSSFVCVFVHYPFPSPAYYNSIFHCWPIELTRAWDGFVSAPPLTCTSNCLPSGAAQLYIPERELLINDLFL